MLNSPADQKSPFVHATNKQTKLLHFTGLVQNFSGKESDNICEKMFEEIFGNLIFVQNVIENKINFYKASTKFFAPSIASKVQEEPLLYCMVTYTFQRRYKFAATIDLELIHTRLVEQDVKVKNMKCLFCFCFLFFKLNHIIYYARFLILIILRIVLCRYQRALTDIYLHLITKMFIPALIYFPSYHVFYPIICVFV